MFKKLSLIMLCMIISACAASGPIFSKLPLSKDKAAVYIYRQEAMTNCCVSPNILLNGTKIGELKNGGYISFLVSSGKQEITSVNEDVGFPELKLSLNIESGKEYFIKWYIGDLQELDLQAMASKYGYHLQQVNSATGLQEITPLKMV